MNIQVKYLMIFSQISGCKSEQVEIVEGSSISQLLDKLILKHGRKFKKALERDIDNRSVIFMVNGTTVEPETVLNENDEVLISYPVGGG